MVPRSHRACGLQGVFLGSSQSAPALVRTVNTVTFTVQLDGHPETCADFSIEQTTATSTQAEWVKLLRRIQERLHLEHAIEGVFSVMGLDKTVQSFYYSSPGDSSRGRTLFPVYSIASLVDGQKYLVRLRDPTRDPTDTQAVDAEVSFWDRWMSAGTPAQNASRPRLVTEEEPEIPEELGLGGGLDGRVGGLLSIDDGQAEEIQEDIETVMEKDGGDSDSDGSLYDPEQDK